MNLKNFLILLLFCGISATIVLISFSITLYNSSLRILFQNALEKHEFFSVNMTKNLTIFKKLRIFENTPLEFLEKIKVYKKDQFRAFSFGDIWFLPSLTEFFFFLP